MIIDKLQEKREEKQRRKYELLKGINDILGQSIFDHELIAGNAKATAHIKKCGSVDQVVQYLEILYNRKHKKILSLPSKSNGRSYYLHHKFADRRINKRIAASNTSQRHGWQVAKLLAEPEPNFHEQ